MINSFLKNKQHPDNSQLRVLIVDDTEAMRMVITMALKDTGYVVTEAENGQQALKMAKKEQFDLIITDIRMPEIDGLMLIKKLRKMKQYRDIPILSLTNLNSENFKQKLKQAGANGWVQKPFGRETLLRTLNSLLAA
ncbi:MAG: response regulator [Gammaproteobacteria bacterium]|nr:response regulator [Gammaproteobacteria bacterium]